MEKTFTVSRRNEGERLDKWLCSKLPKHSRKQIKSLLDDGRVLINRKRVLIAGWELEEDDSVVVKIPPNFRESEPETRAPKSAASSKGGASGGASNVHKKSASISESLERHLKRKVTKAPAASKPKNAKDERLRKNFGKLRVYHHDRDLLVVEKPSGLLSVPPKGEDTHKGSLLKEVRSYLKRKHKGSAGSYVHPLHRLDVETSGIMVFALSNVGKQLELQFKHHSIRREYVALVFGRVEKESGVIRRALEKGKFGGGKNVRTTSKDKGKQAVTEYRVGERYENATLLNISVRTGRTHQIRVHMASEGHPVVGDKKYAENRSEIKFHRQALHAKMLGFKHPTTGKKMLFKSSMPEDMKKLVDELRGV
jgi:23S rRNA pseudouridine1911/1915/1917 synthase